MAVYLDEPLHDEALFSIIGRYRRDIFVSDLMAFLTALTGYHPHFSPSLAYNLQYVADQTSRVWDKSGEQIAQELTLFPYYAALCHDALRSDLLDRCLYRRPGRMPGSLCKLLHQQLHVRYCPSCWREDTLAGLPPYWRRTHQLPGVMVCVDHQVPLRELARRDRWPVPAPDAPSITLACHFSTDAEMAVQLRVAQLSADLLHGDPAAAHLCTLVDWLAVARDHGYARGRGDLEAKRLVSAIVEHFGEAYLRATGLLPDGAQNWMVGRLYGHQCAPAPLQAILLSTFFSDLQRRTVACPWPNCPNPYASHGPGHRVDAQECHRSITYYYCACGFSFRFATNAEGGREAVIPTVYGPAYAARARELHLCGMSIAAIARTLHVSESCAARLVRGTQHYTHRDLDRFGADLAARWLQLVRTQGGITAASRADQGLWRKIRRYRPDLLA